MSAPSYFVVMIDYGPRGREAIVDPEMTRAGAVARVREVLGDYGVVDFVHHVVPGQIPEDLTREILAEALDILLDDEDRDIDHQALAFDYAHDLRKHEERV